MAFLKVHFQNCASYHFTFYNETANLLVVSYIYPAASHSSDHKLLHVAL